jgi:hypothetical protein
MPRPLIERRFPFRTSLSLKLLVQYWENAIESGKVPFGDALLDHIRRVPELKDPITDMAVVEKNRALINYLMSAVTAPSQDQKELTAATEPFHFKAVYETAAMRKQIGGLESLEGTAVVNIPSRDLHTGRTIQACLMILQQFYSVSLNFDKPILFTVRNPDNGLDKVYKVEVGRQFCEIISKGRIQPIDARIIKFLTEKVYDVDLWLQYINPDNFEFRGFMVFRMIDVTEQEMVSSIKYDLLEKDAVSRRDSFTAIQHKLRSIFGMPEIRLGLAYFDESNNIVVNTDRESECWKSIAQGDAQRPNLSDYAGSIYERSYMEKRYIAIEDLEAYPYKSRVEEELLSKGIRGILLAPLIDSGEIVGMLELSAPDTGTLNPVTANKVESVLPMFTSAVKRAREEAITEVRALIQEECTNIHPVVQWRFVEAGRRVLEQRRRGEPAVFEDIVFKDVYPLFGMADIRNSSIERTAAIREDLLENLQLAKDVLWKIQAHTPLPLLEEILYKAYAQFHKLNFGLAAGDEISALDFLRREIHPLLEHFESESAIQPAIAHYRSHLDPASGIVYHRRRDFENSLAMINQMIGNYLNEAQTAAQEMFPHYFEKYQTDGVEYTIYLGTSLTKNRKFNSLFLKNFRLWQLLLSCEIEKRMEALKPQLTLPLDITQLILVHDQALSIRFRPDEKQFDVDGAYDIRYEIIKKRIDKATIKDSDERLTQPGKIAVIYNQPKVREEYKRYFEYLASKKILDPKVEDLELDDLPGATGLRALRVEIGGRNLAGQSDSKQLLHDLTASLQLH